MWSDPKHHFKQLGHIWSSHSVKYFTIWPNQMCYNCIITSLTLTGTWKIEVKQRWARLVHGWMTVDCAQWHVLKCNHELLLFFNTIFCVKPYVPREPRRDPSNRRLYEHGIYIWHCQESNSQPVPSQVRTDPTRPQWRTSIAIEWPSGKRQPN